MSKVFLEVPSLFICCHGWSVEVKTKYMHTRTTTSLSRCLLLVLTLFCPGWGYLNIEINATALAGGI